MDRTSTGTCSIDFFDPSGNPQGNFTGGTLKATPDQHLTRPETVRTGYSHQGLNNLNCFILDS